VENRKCGSICIIPTCRLTSNDNTITGRCFESLLPSCDELTSIQLLLSLWELISFDRPSGQDLECTPGKQIRHTRVAWVWEITSNEVNSRTQSVLLFSSLSKRNGQTDDQPVLIEASSFHLSYSPRTTTVHGSEQKETFAGSPTKLYVWSGGQGKTSLVELHTLRSAIPDSEQVGVV